MKFKIKEPDYEKSPYTGMTRKHWIDAGVFLLEGAFSHVKGFEDPILFRRSETEITYPRQGDPFWRYAAERFEALARTFSIAAPLIKDNPEIKIGEYKLLDYYKYHILEGTKKGGINHFGDLDKIIEATNNIFPQQQTVEFSLLVIGLMETKEVLWDKASKEEQDQIANVLSQYGHYVTCPQNWRFFNVLILTFLKLQGYKINEIMLKDHLYNLLTYYAGDGWYRDGEFFDYYSAWAFQVYGPLWCNWYGYEYEPEIALAIENNLNSLMEHYSRFFDANGHSIMWGRSSVYRNCASSAFAAGFYLKNCNANPGLARRIMSGNLLQFLEREDVFIDSIPCIGFYGMFKPMVQPYSCAGSPFWMGKSFLGVCLDENSPFWQAKENNGIWDTIEDNIESVFVKGPGIQIVNYGKSKTSEIKTSKFFMNQDDGYMPSYSRLAFNSAFLWDSYDKCEPIAMNYVLTEQINNKELLPNCISSCGEKDGVFYRRMLFDLKYSIRDNIIDLAEINIKNGVIRVDRPRIPGKPYTLTLGHYAMPHIDGICEREQKVIDGKKVYILKSKNLQLALIAYSGWDLIDIIEHENNSAATKKSSVMYVKSEKKEMYSGMELLVTIMLHKTDNTEWSKEELCPIISSKYKEISKSGSPCGLSLELRDGRSFDIDFGGMEGNLSI